MRRVAEIFFTPWCCIAVLALQSGLVNAAELGRLFTTPSERQHLDQMRSSGGLMSIPDISATLPPADAPVRFNGYVKRSSGRSDAWINGQHAGSDQALGRRLGTGNTIRVHVPDSSRTVRIKAGQVMDPFTGRVREAYEAHTPDSAPAVVGEQAPDQ